MDTRFWGPSGWRLLHLATFTYNPKMQRRHMHNFLESLPFILPCKYCRASLTDYYRDHPFAPALKSRMKLIRWMYIIHNKVNAKLRSQGLLTVADPSLEQVKDYYTTWITTTTPEQRMQSIWDFLFSVAYCHPRNIVATPIQNCPAYATKCKSKYTRNRWNTLKSFDRLHYFKRFWHSLPGILDETLEWQRILNKTSPNLSCRRSTIAWLWRMRCALDTDFKDPYTQVCHTIASHSSNCSSSIKTCRRTRRSKTQRSKTRRNKIGNKL